MSLSINLDVCRVIHPLRDRWLNACFVKPQIYDFVADASSILLEAPDGFGKTTLMTLIKRAYDDSWLHAEFDTDQVDLEDTDTILYSQLFKNLHRELWENLKQHPEYFAKLGARAQAMKYFVQNHLGQEQLAYQLEILEEDNPDYADAIKTFAKVAVSDFFDKNTDTAQKLDYLSECVRKIGLRGIWVWIELSEHQRAAQYSVQLVEEILDSLKITRRRDVYFKCLATPLICEKLAQSRSIQTLSVDVYKLTWTEDELLTIINKRLAIATQNKVPTLTDLLNNEQLKQAQQFVSESNFGHSPTTWINLGRYALQQAAEKRSTNFVAHDWLQIQKKCYAESAKLRFDEQGYLWRGTHQIKEISPAKRALHPILKHLYDNPGYHTPQKLANKLGWDETTLNTYVHRLRAAVEPLWSAYAESGIIYLVKEPQGYALLHTLNAK